MRSKRVIRYYCDHCSKGSLTRDSMERHESRCFRNVARLCEMCENGQDGATLIKAIEEGGMEKLREVTESCPACIMAGIIQFRKANPASEHMEYFDYKKERDEYLSERYREEMSGIGYVP